MSLYENIYILEVMACYFSLLLLNHQRIPQIKQWNLVCYFQRSLNRNLGYWLRVKSTNRTLVSAGIFLFHLTKVQSTHSRADKELQDAIRKSSSFYIFLCHFLSFFLIAIRCLLPQVSALCLDRKEKCKEVISKVACQPNQFNFPRGPIWLLAIGCHCQNPITWPP